MAQGFQVSGPLHFVGIGGIGMSGIAEVLQASGYGVTGSDVSENANVKRLRTKGIPVHIGHCAENIEGASVVVVSTAIQSDNPEVIAARARNIPVIRRAEMLAELMRLKRSICISGTHGKTTTTSLCATLLDTARMDATVVNGGIINAYGTNARLGAGDWIVAEADESDGSFLLLPPTLAIVTNIDAEHMEHYGTFPNLVKCFEQFVHHLPFYGLAILCHDHPVVREMSERVIDRRKVSYGLTSGADIQAVNIRMDSKGAVFDVTINHHCALLTQHPSTWSSFQNFELPLYGEHNVQNALTLFAVAFELGLSEEVTREALKNFSGVKRRFTKTGEVNGAVIIDDYAHHPVEIEAVLKAAKNAQPRRIISVIQPHRYTRLSNLFDQFVTSLDLSDVIVVCPIYEAGEAPIAGVTQESFTQALRVAYPSKQVTCIEGAADLAPLLNGLLQPKDMVLCMGAGSISQWAHDLPEQLFMLLATQERLHAAT